MAEQTGQAYNKPLPLMEGPAGEFYQYCKNQELRFQRCTRCGTWRHVPRDMCAQCGSWKWEWAKSSGRGKLFTWTVVALPMHPAFKDEVPYAVCLIEMEEGPRIVSRIVDVAPHDLRMDMPVEVFFDAVTPEVTLPKFRRLQG
jgi:uncharacterized OB-fold protein